MTIRTMRKTISDIEIYSSSFDPETGRIVRKTLIRDRADRWKNVFDYATETGAGPKKKLREASGEMPLYRYDSYSPSPETVDVQINNWCDFGCPYCYQDSTVSQKDRMSPDMLRNILGSFEHVPYQVAIGGGEPAAHPEFIEILRTCREMGTVPNYTTAGHIWRGDVIEATNQYCGGVAITYHRHKGLDQFVERYRKWRGALTVPLSIHLLCQKGCAADLRDMTKLMKLLGLDDFRVTMLAYYPTTGRGRLDDLMLPGERNVDLPAAIADAVEAGVKIAFSEGLLPYFLSRPSLPVDTSAATAQEGRFSCYIDARGRMGYSSFSEVSDVTDGDYQKAWDDLYFRTEPGYNPCGRCKARFQCSVPSFHSYGACAYATHNKEDRR